MPRLPPSAKKKSARFSGRHASSAATSPARAARRSHLTGRQDNSADQSAASNRADSATLGKNPGEQHGCRNWLRRCSKVLSWILVFYSAPNALSSFGVVLPALERLKAPPSCGLFSCRAATRAGMARCCAECTGARLTIRASGRGRLLCRELGVGALHIGGHVVGHRALLFHRGGGRGHELADTGNRNLDRTSEAATSAEIPLSASISLAILSVACVAWLARFLTSEARRQSPCRLRPRAPTRSWRSARAG